MTIRITGVRSRSDAGRILFNFVDGSDYLNATVIVGNANFRVAEDTWLYWLPTYWRTMDEVSGAVGKQIANGIALVGGVPFRN